MPQKTTAPLTGGCFCGEARYRITAALVSARACHCSKCRKVFSGAGSAYAEIEPGSFEWMHGEESVSRFMSSADWGLGFCRYCGTTLCGFFKSTVHGVTLGSIDGDPGIEIGMHLFVASKATWDHIGGVAPRYDEHPPA